jgi:hypothetical protein
VRRHSNVQLLIAGVAIIAFASPTDAQTIAGTVVERLSRLPVRNAGIVLIDSHNRIRNAVLTDSLGRFHVSAPTSGTYRLSFQRAGLATLTVEKIAISASQTAIVDTALTVATVLPNVTVSGVAETSALPGNPHRLDDFYRRKAMGNGVFLTKSDIDDHANAYTQELFSHIAGLKVRTHGSEWFLRSQRCSGRGIPGLDAGALGGSIAGPDPKLEPMVFIDGHRVQDFKMLYELVPSQIEAIEVYQGAAELPAEARGDACFAIFVWLRR